MWCWAGGRRGFPRRSWPCEPERDGQTDAWANSWVRQLRPCMSRMAREEIITTAGMTSTVAVQMSPPFRTAHLHIADGVWTASKKWKLPRRVDRRKGEWNAQVAAGIGVDRLAVQ